MFLNRFNDIIKMRKITIYGAQYEININLTSNKILSF